MATVDRPRGALYALKLSVSVCQANCKMIDPHIDQQIMIQQAS